MNHLTSNITDAIANGNFDSDLSALRAAIEAREAKISGAPSLLALRVGQTVWFNDKTRPTYLIGQEARITKINRTRVVVALANGEIGRFQGSAIRTSIELLRTTKP